VLQRHVVSDHGWLVNFVWIGSYRRGWARFRGDQRLRAWTVRPQHPAIFWHFCGNFHSVRRPLQKLPCCSRYEKWTWHAFCTSSKKGLENRSSRFEPKISWISFSRGSGQPLTRYFFGRTYMPFIRWGWVFLERTRILSGFKFTKHFIKILVVETKRFVGSFVNVILTRQTCG